MDNIWNTKNDWLALYDIDDLPVVNNYSLNDDGSKSLSNALTTQARIIYEDFKDRDIVISMSGGIDSQQAAYGFANANLPVKYVYFKTSFNSRPEKEQFYVEEFARKYNIPVNIIERNYTSEDVKDLVKKGNYFKDKIATAPLILFNSLYQEYISQNPNSIFVTSTMMFTFSRDKNLCSGGILTDRGTFNEVSKRTSNLKLKIIPFNFYSSHLWEYYEYVHRQELVLQFHKRFQAKNLAYTELGFPLREKLGAFDWFTDSFHEPETKTRIDFANDRSMLSSNKMNFLMHFWGHSHTQALKLYNTMSSHYTNDFVRFNLYSFETDVDKYDL